MAVDSRGNEILAPGSSGGSVEWLKQTLGWWGYDAGTGAAYDGTTEAAVRAFQARYGYNQTGSMDEATWELMDALARGAPAPNAITTEQSGGPLGGYSGAPERTGGTGTGGTGAAPPAAPPSAANRDALAKLEALLRDYGLIGLLPWVQGLLVNGASDAEITLELYQQEAFKARFPVIGERRDKGLTPMSAAEVIEYETRGRELMRRAGLTSDAFTSQSYLQGLMGMDVSLAEVGDRLNDGLLKITQAPLEVRAAFGSYFGTTGDAALATLFLDPARAAPELEKMAMTTVAGGIGSRFGVQLAQGIAREIADTGVSDAAIWQGFAQLDSIKSLFQESISETTDLTMGSEGVAATFNTRPGSQEILQRRALSRGAAFRGGGGAGGSNDGVTGLGVADS